MRIIIVGLGDIGLELAYSLNQREDCEVVCIDTSEEVCEKLSGDIDALVLHGDGSHPEMLKKAQLSEADALVATTASDAINAVVAMLGNRKRVGKVIVKLNGTELRPACEEIGVTKIIAPKIAATAEIVSSLFGFDKVNFSEVASGGLELVLLEVGNEGAGKIGELEIPREAHIVAVLRGERMLIPHAESAMENGDRVMLLIKNRDLLEDIRKQLEKGGKKEGEER